MTKEDIFPENQGTSGSEIQQFDGHTWKESKSNFEAEFLELLNPESSDGRLIFAFFRARLKQFHLERVHSEASVLNEVYLRAIDKIQEGAVIRIPHAWIRATGYNYIRELSRQQQKSIQQEDYHLEIHHEEEKQILNLMALEEELAAEQSLIRKAFEMLTDVERQLLHLKIVEGLSWKAIQQQYEFKESNLATLRKRKQRVLKKLHHFYHTLKKS